MTCFRNITKDFPKCLVVVKYHSHNDTLFLIWLKMQILLHILILISLPLYILNSNK